jgi:hypothetical protein
VAELRIETNEYRISRTQLVYWSAFEYVRRFWPAFIAFPITGLVIYLTVQVREVQALSILMSLWPLSIFTRAIIITRKAAKRVTSPTKVVCEGDHVYFHVNPTDLNYRIHKDSIRDVKARVEYVVIELWRYRLLYVPYAAFRTPEDVQQFRMFTGVIEPDQRPTT